MSNPFTHIQVFLYDSKKVEFIARKEGIPIYDAVTALIEIWEDSFSDYFSDYDEGPFNYKKPLDGNVGVQKTLTGGIIGESDA